MLCQGWPKQITRYAHYLLAVLPHSRVPSGTASTPTYVCVCACDFRDRTKRGKCNGILTCKRGTRASIHIYFILLRSPIGKPSSDLMSPHKNCGLYLSLLRAKNVLNIGKTSRKSLKGLRIFIQAHLLQFFGSQSSSLEVANFLQHALNFTFLIFKMSVIPSRHPEPANRKGWCDTPP